MSDIQDNSLVLPSTDADRKKIKDALYEIVAAYRFIDDKREYIKDVFDTLKSNYKMPKKYSAKLAKALYKDDIKDTVAEVEEINLIYETLFTKGGEST